ncbi:hypothetical protein GCM10010201_31790 [Pilimelia columellifera subsp. columellifera]|uniref:Uncharacterized protein n=1 Tax=Pilimelia columellifera subsp. columellifera TaxID=706583 RepID=A0ABN3NPU0_9ACTN
MWLGLVRDEAAIDLLESWLAAGGPGLASLPAALSLQVFPAPKSVGSDRVR